MATLDEATHADLSNYKRVETPAQTERFISEDLLPRYNPMLRFSLPPNQSSPDSQRNFYLGSKIPQFRLARPIVQAQTGNITQNINVGNSSSSSSTQTIISASNQDQLSAIVTPLLGVGVQWQGTIVMSKTVTIKKVTANFPARIRIYSTNAQQINDASRLDGDVSSLNGTQHGVILDLTLDTTLSFICSPAPVGGNCDDPDINTLYVTVDNIGAASNPITISINYVGEES